MEGRLAARQRWRLAFARDASAAQLAHRVLAEAWIERLAASGLPLPRLDAGRPRAPLAFALPLPVGMAVEADLADLLLADRLPLPDVRNRLGPTLPDGIRVLELHDVWLGAPALAASVVAADYRIELEMPAPPADDLRVAAAALLSAATLPRRREKASGSVSYDLRPLLGSIEVDDATAVGRLRLRTLVDPARGAGRPDEVLAALGESLGRPIEVGAIVRERILLREDLPPGAGTGSADAAG